MENVFAQIKSYIQEEVERQVEQQMRQIRKDMEAAFEGPKPAKEIVAARKVGTKTPLRKDVSPEASILLDYINRYKDLHGHLPENTPTYREIMENTRLNSKDIADGYHELEVRRLIRRMPQGRKKLVEIL